MNANQPDRAIDEFRAALQADPNNVEVRGNLGVLLFFKGKPDEAAAELRAALKLQPKLWKMQVLLGMCDRRAGRLAEARKNLEESFPHLQEPKLQRQGGMELIELYFGSNEFDKAANVVSVLRRADPTDIELNYTAQRIYSSLADEATLAVAMLAPNSARMHQLMAHEMARQGDSAGAINHYREALRLAPSLPGLHFELAEILYGTGDAGAAEAELEYQAAMKVNPYDAVSECRLGEIAAKRADQKNAHDHFARALSIQPDNADANLGLARVYVSTGEAPKALPLLEHAVRVDPTNATAHFRLAAAYRTSGRAEDAKRELEEFRKYKEMKEKLRELYQAMRLAPVKQERADTETP